MSLNPSTQYATERNLRARQRLWEQQQPAFDIVGWVLELADISRRSDHVVLDVGCGNGAYLRELRRRGVMAIGGDLSMGMLAAAAPHRTLINADVEALPLRAHAFDVVLAPHMLYHVPARIAAATEIRRVLRHSGVLVAVTNGLDHMRSLRDLIERAVRVATPGWQMRNPASHAFSLENGETQLRTAFHSVTCVRPQDVAPVNVTDATIASDYVASIADHYQDETTRPWSEVVDDVRRAVADEIRTNGSFLVTGDTGAFVCR